MDLVFLNVIVVHDNGEEFDVWLSACFVLFVAVLERVGIGCFVFYGDFWNPRVFCVMVKILDLDTGLFCDMVFVLLNVCLSGECCCIFSIPTRGVVCFCFYRVNWYEFRNTFFGALVSFFG